MRLVNASNKNPFEISGIVFVINSYNEEYTIKTIDHDIFEIKLNFNELKKIEGEEPFAIDKARDKDEDWINKFSKTKEFEKEISNTLPIDLKIGSSAELNNYTTLIIPISVLKNSNLSNYIISFNPTIYCKINDTIKYLRAPSSIIYNPFTKNTNFDVIKYLREEGI